MLQCVLCGALQLFKVGAGVLQFVARALVLALLLVELDFTVFHLCFRRLHLCQALVCLLFCIGSDAQGLFTAFKHLVFLQVLRLAYGIVDDDFRAALCH